MYLIKTPFRSFQLCVEEKESAIGCLSSGLVGLILGGPS